MSDDIKINDARLFNADGSLRDDDAPAAKKQSVEKQNPAEEKSATHEKPSHTSKSSEPTPSQAHHNPNQKIDFNTFILSLASSVQISLGIVPHPITNQTQKDLNHAKQTIDILGMLEEKTQNNLNPDESGLLKNVLFQLRMQYVELTKDQGTSS